MARTRRGDGAWVAPCQRQERAAALVQLVGVLGVGGATDARRLLHDRVERLEGLAVAAVRPEIGEPRQLREVLAVRHRPDGRPPEPRVARSLAQPGAPDEIRQPDLVVVASVVRARPRLAFPRVHRRPPRPRRAAASTPLVRIRHRSRPARRGHGDAGAAPLPHWRDASSDERQKPHGVKRSSVRLPDLPSSSTCLLNS